MHPITVTEKALEQARVFLRDHAEYAEKSLRTYIEGKNCDGFSYGVSFDEKRESDVQFEIEGVKFLVDSESLVFVKGSTLDWVDDERGQGFTVDNPNSPKFRGKFFKRKVWQDFLEKRQTSE